MSDCPRLHRMFGSCLFRPRYDLSPVHMHINHPSGEGAGTFLEKEKLAQIYVRDVCVRCGKTIERLPPQRSES